MYALSCFHLVLPGGSSHGPALSEPFVNPTPQGNISPYLRSLGKRLDTNFLTDILNYLKLLLKKYPMCPPPPRFGFIPWNICADGGSLGSHCGPVPEGGALSLK